MALAVLLGACGGEPSGAPEPATPATGEEGSDDGAAPSVPHFTVEGRGESAKTSAVLQVVEGEDEVTLSITGADGSDNLIVIYAAFDGVESVVGDHRLPIGLVEDRQVFAVSSLDGQTYQSLSGELSVSLSAEGHAEGTFQIGLSREQITVVAPGAEAPSAPSEPELTLAGTFESDWTVTCTSYIMGFTGGHSVSDSPYCNALTF
jgi:hypothetical protein